MYNSSEIQFALFGNMRRVLVRKLFTLFKESRTFFLRKVGGDYIHIAETKLKLRTRVNWYVGYGGSRSGDRKTGFE